MSAAFEFARQRDDRLYVAAGSRERDGNLHSRFFSLVVPRYSDIVHIAMFMDYHPATLGGVQTAVDSLCRGLENAGHRVTLVVAPLAGARVESAANVVELEAVPVAVNGFPMVLPSKRNARRIDDAFAARGPVDVVHTHTTYGVAIAGMKAARRHRLPLVHTAQSRDDAFLERTSPRPIRRHWHCARCTDASCRIVITCPIVRKAVRRAMPGGPSPLRPRPPTG